MIHIIFAYNKHNIVRNVITQIDATLVETISLSVNHKYIFQKCEYCGKILSTENIRQISLFSKTPSHLCREKIKAYDNLVRLEKLPIL